MASIPDLSNTHDFLKSPPPPSFFVEGALMSGLDSMILQALELSKEAKDLIWRAVRTGCQENPIRQTLTTVSGWAQRASVTQTCAWPSTATSASTSQKVGSASLLLSAGIVGRRVSCSPACAKEK